ncbi:hypothetical protein HaLaN_07760 [Haematococcus lacustris]|uniref:Uncharacterized protein n=1 Tax=Haematococcus lacustris TaxID=44745 RepID=A0A699YX64_HAELA|nr:hypothetical protein HaLaN_07760 [Haematococcus lacustris]
MDAGLSAEEQHQLQSLTVSIGRARLQAVAGSQPGSVHASHSTSGGSCSSQELLVGGETASSGTNMPLQWTAATAEQLTLNSL